MKKRWLSVAMSAVLVCSMAGCSLKSPAPSTTAATTAAEAAQEKAEAQGEAEAEAQEGNDYSNVEPEITLVYAEVNPPDTIMGQMAENYAENVARLSEGKIKIDVRSSGVLGSENDVVDAMFGGNGTVDMSRISAFILNAYGCEKSVLLSLPYTFRDRDHFWAFAESDLADEFLSEPHEIGLGVRGLFYCEEGFRHFFTTKEISGLEDLKGLKLRVSNDPIMNGMVEGLGANPTVVSYNELYSALQTGVVDGAENPVNNYKSNAFTEVAPYLILDGHTLGASEVIMTDEAWDKLTEEQQNILMEASAMTADFNHKMSEDAENATLEEIKAEGIHVIDVNDKTPWQEACKDVIDASTTETRDLYDQLIALK
ncbi:MAG: TRAP transporter substrate-binding protein [Bariatricus sp.]